MDLPNINVRAPQRPVYVDQTAAMAKSQGLSVDYTEHVNNVINLFASQTSLQVTNSQNNNATVGQPSGSTGTPALDNPSDVKQLEKDLEKLISYLQLDNDKRQAEMAKHRIEVQKAEVEERHTEQMAKLKETMDAMNTSNGLGLFMKLFGWAMAAAAIAMAVVASVATGGAAALPIASAAIAVFMAVASSTGAMEWFTGVVADLCELMGMDKDTANMVATIAVAVIGILVSLAPAGVGALLARGSEAAAKAAAETAEEVIKKVVEEGGEAAGQAAGGAVGSAGSAGGSAAGKVGEEVVETALQTKMKSVQYYLGIGMGLAGLAGAGISGVTSAKSYCSGIAQSELSEIEKFLSIMRQRVDESQEELDLILQQLQGTMSNLIQILNSATDTQMEIAQQMGAMA